MADGRNALYAIAIPFIVGSVVSAQATARGIGYRPTILVGVAAMLAGMYSFAELNSLSSVLLVAASIAPVGFGAGLTISATLSAIQNSVERSEIGLASSLLTFMLFLGSAVGLAVLGTIQTNSFSSQLHSIARNSPNSAALVANPNLIGNALATPQALAEGIAQHPALAALVPELRSAFALSLEPVFQFVVGLLVVSLFSSVLIRGSMAKTATPRDAHLESIPIETEGPV